MFKSLTSLVSMFVDQSRGDVSVAEISCQSNTDPSLSHIFSSHFVKTEIDDYTDMNVFERTNVAVVF